MVGKTLETIYSAFFTWCCFPYVHFCELYLSCVYCCHLMCICCILTYICGMLCVFVVPYVYLFYYVCIAVLTLDAGLPARSQYLEGPATGHLDTGFSWFPCVYKQMLRWLPSFYYMLLMQPSRLKFPSYSSHICVHVK
jgi:hypothetical protein